MPNFSASTANALTFIVQQFLFQYKLTLSQVMLQHLVFMIGHALTGRFSLVLPSVCKLMLSQTMLLFLFSEQIGRLMCATHMLRGCAMLSLLLADDRNFSSVKRTL